MKHRVAVLLIVLLNFALIAQPVLGEEMYQNKLEFTEQLDSNAQTTYFNPENSTPLPQLLHLDEGVYKGPQYPFAALKLDIRDVTLIFLNFSLNLSYQDIMNGVWDWEILIPFSGNFYNWSLWMDGKFLTGDHTEYDHDIPLSNVAFNITQTDYGMLIELYYALFPSNHTFTFRATTYTPPTLYLCREEQNSTLTLIQSNKTVYDIHAGYAFLFKRGFGQKGMGAITGQDASFYFIDATSSNTTYTTIGLPVWIFQGTTLTIRIHEYLNDSEIFYVNKTFTQTGFYYIYQSSSRPANESLTDYYTTKFDFLFSHPVKFLFCALAPVSHQFDPNTGEYADNTVKFNGKNFDYFGLVSWHKTSPSQFALVTKQNGATLYDFGFATVQEYSTGDYIIYEHGNWHKYTVIRRRTVKSIGAKVDDLLFGGAFEFSAHNDILSIIIGGITKIIDLGKRILQFLMHLGQIIWQYLLKFVKFLINLASWIWDSLGGIFNYLLYLSIPISIMFIVSYIARWAKGLRATDENAKGVKQ